MDFAVVMYFDKKTEEIITRHINELVDSGVNNYVIEEGVPPHITLGIWNSEDAGVAMEKLSILSNNNKKIKVRFSSIGIFKKEKYILFLAPVINEDLLQIHSSFYKEFSSLSDNFVDYYRNNNWVPHTTLAMDLTDEELMIAVRCASKAELYIEAEISELALISCCPFKEIIRCEISKI